MKTKYDYIILGAGASGLMLAYRMSNDSYFDDKSILIIDKEKDKGNDRTWCYWEEGNGEWDDLSARSWTKVFFGSHSFSKTIPIEPYSYKLIKSEQFYKTLWKRIESKPNFTFVQDSVDSFTELKNVVHVITGKANYFGLKLFNSSLNPVVYNLQDKYPLIHQHFVGWYVRTKEDSFDSSTATFMDFTVSQKGNTRFMYVLPMDKKTALFEYTLFSKNLLDNSEYEREIVRYLRDKNIMDYEIVEKEMGNIPMTSFKFSNLNSEHILNIGTAGGWTKASTGYTFKNTSEKTKQLIEFLKQESDLTKFHKKSKFSFYDLIFLDVLANHNAEGAGIFSSMFKKADIRTIFKFLDEDSSLLEDLKIVRAVPPKRFLQAFLKRLFK
ncbi:lycopene beta-cyclase [Winogradskyella epiphytica]|uniref:Lycopene beta-cyclase n=1 Tax=Winogradskyella epiphytica TaxID=262005 RepID=A0A2V4XD88_9FLAO|nr:lycopene cyclase family protein [Winogradskyella epiphytica]PYE80329.1 lycopene beta-cyclase [Winogradskyella epiphytica]GGW70600.1 lycopene cyclase [Winogradskyella epiphytica]